MKSRDLIKLIEADGWYLEVIKGSHHHYKHQVKKGKVTIPHSKPHIPKGTVNGVLKQAGLK